jgi:beta-alanine--pyruvate transaminase
VSLKGVDIVREHVGSPGRPAFCYEIPPAPETPVFTSGDGVWLADDRGRRYLDGISGIFVASLGYGSAPIIDAMTTQLRKLAFSPPLHGLHEEPIALAEELVRFAGAPFDCAKLLNGGSEAIEAALRVTRLYFRRRGKPHKTKIISNYNGYHGATYGALSLTGRPDVQRFEPRLPGFVHVWPPDCFACPFGKEYPSCGITCAGAVEQTILAEGSDSVAAVVVEPLIHLLGMVVPPAEYFAEIRAICDRHDVLLIFDEIVTGCGRTGRAFAAQTFAVEPDLLCAGKSLSGGYAPLSALLMSERVSWALRDDDGNAALAPSHTYAGNPVSAVAGRAALALIAREETLARVRDAGALLAAELAAAVGSRGRVRGVGLLYGVKLPAPPHRAAGEMGKAVESRCRERGMIVRGESDWIVVAPAYVTTDAELRQIARTIGAAIDELWAR